jgi:hypothetical protein
MAELRATPYANPLTGLSNDAIQGLLGYMRDPKRTQQLQGLGRLIESTGIPKTVERAAYADSPSGLLNALTNANRANVPLLKPETADALMTLAKEGQNPKGGLNAKGRASLKAQGQDIKAPVKSGDNPRRASFLARMAGNDGPEYKDGKPTRLLLSLQAWGASSKADARAKAKAISARNKK